MRSSAAAALLPTPPRRPTLGRPTCPAPHAPADPYLIQRYGSLGGSPVRLISKTYFGVRARPEEEVGGGRGRRHGGDVGLLCGGAQNWPSVQAAAH